MSSSNDAFSNPFKYAETVALAGGRVILIGETIERAAHALSTIAQGATGQTSTIKTFDGSQHLILHTSSKGPVRIDIRSRVPKHDTPMFPHPVIDHVLLDAAIPPNDPIFDQTTKAVLFSDMLDAHRKTAIVDFTAAV